MAEYKVLEWNINLRSGYRKFIPKFVAAEIENQNADIVILTEFLHFDNSKCKDQDKENYFYKSEDFLKKTFKDNGYDYITSMSGLTFKANDVVIAWKLDKFIKNNDNQVCYFTCDINNPNIPNFIVVCLNSIIEEKAIYVAGIRVTMTEYGSSNNYPYLQGSKNKYFYSTQAVLRYNEMRMIYYTLNKLTKSDDKILIAGDFNNYSRNTVREEWNMKKITCGCHGYKPYTPSKGGSWDGDCKNEYALDHFITKNCIMKYVDYNRDFTKNDKKIYYKDCKYKLKDIKPPYPDHAMLIGTLVVD